MHGQPGKCSLQQNCNFTLDALWCGAVTPSWHVCAHNDELETSLIHPVYFSCDDRGMGKIKVILIDCYRHSHLFPLEFPLFPACVQARARLLCLSDCLCFCMCACSFASVTRWMWTCVWVCVHVCVVCFNTSATCGNLLIWSWNMCSCLCLSSVCSTSRSLSLLSLSLTALIGSVDQVTNTPWCMPTSPCFSVLSPILSSCFFLLPLSYKR